MKLPTGRSVSDLGFDQIANIYILMKLRLLLPRLWHNKAKEKENTCKRNVKEMQTMKN